MGDGYGRGLPSWMAGGTATPAEKKALEAVLTRFEEKFIPEPNSGCWLWTAGASEVGRGQYRPRFYLNGRDQLAYRVSYQFYRGPVGSDLYVCHKCDNPICVNPDHLFLGTPSDNAQDMVRKGRQVKGQARLTEEQAAAIYLDGRAQADIAADYGIVQQTVSKIKRGARWVSITESL